MSGRLGDTPDDFVVEEELAFAPAATGDHCYLRVRKRGLTTRELVLLVARQAGVDERDIGSAGMKDKHAVTSQWLSVPASAVPPEHWTLPAGVEIIEVTRHVRKLRTGQQRGNRFRLRLVDVRESSVECARAILQRVERHGFLNYFGEQRFGRAGDNVEQALAWLERGAPAVGPRGRFLRKLLPSVLQSEIFNRYVTARLGRGLDELLRGEVVRLSGSASMFVVEDPDAERARLRDRDIFLTGPLPGPKMKRAAAEAAELERAVAAGLCLDEEQRALLERLAPGTRRDVLAYPEQATARTENDSLVLEFFLPSGSYATELLRELTAPRSI